MSKIKQMMNIKGAMQLFKKNLDLLILITLNVPIYQLPYELWTLLLMTQQKLKNNIQEQ